MNPWAMPEFFHMRDGPENDGTWKGRLFIYDVFPVFREVG